MRKINVSIELVGLNRWLAGEKDGNYLKQLKNNIQKQIKIDAPKGLQTILNKLKQSHPHNVASIIDWQSTYPKRKIELDLNICSDSVIRQINSEMRGVDKATDVISVSRQNSIIRETSLLELGLSKIDSKIMEKNEKKVTSSLNHSDVERLFKLAESNLDEYFKNFYLGQIWISLDTALAHSCEDRLLDEIRSLYVHGVLHILNFDHISPHDFREMSQLEKQILEKLKWKGSGLCTEAKMSKKF